MQPLKIKKDWHEWNLSFEAVVAKRKPAITGFGM